MIRIATESDLDAIDRIYNQAIDAGFRTAHLAPMSPAERLAWLRTHDEKEYPVYLYDRDGSALGWASLSPYRPGREALEEVAEVSFYVDFDHHGEGIGSELVKHCLEQAPTLGKRILFAIIIEGNEGSNALLEKFGFERWGFLPQVVHSHGEFRGQWYLGKILN